MDIKDIHPSHEMKEFDEFADPHMGTMCIVCHYMTCFLCKTGEGMDDEELADECIGEHWADSYKRDREWEVSDLLMDY